jgi:hypothetical protein
VSIDKLFGLLDSLIVAVAFDDGRPQDVAVEAKRIDTIFRHRRLTSKPGRDRIVTCLRKGKKFRALWYRWTVRIVDGVYL